MLQKLIMTTFTPLGDKTETNCWENRPFTMTWPDNYQQKEKAINTTIKKKPKRMRTAFTTDQIRSLERTFARHRYISTETRREMAKSLDIHEKCIKVWFQNRRMKEKRCSSDSSCDSSSEGFSSEPVSTSPATQGNDEDHKTEYPSQYNINNNSSEYAYQLPTYGVMNEIAQSLYGMQSHNVPTFYNDGNIYPTHYYPLNLNYTSVEDNASNNYHDTEVNQYWPSNHTPYYCPM